MRETPSVSEVNQKVWRQLECPGFAARELEGERFNVKAYRHIKEAQRGFDGLDVEILLHRVFEELKRLSSD